MKEVRASFFTWGELGMVRQWVCIHRRAYSTFFYSCDCIYSLLLLTAFCLYHAQCFLEPIKTPFSMHSSTAAHVWPTNLACTLLQVDNMSACHFSEVSRWEKHICRVPITVACLCAVVWHLAFPTMDVIVCTWDEQSCWLTVNKRLWHAC